MTEDDTFLRLKKCTFEQLQDEFIRIRHRFAGTENYTEWATERKDTAQRLGWTVREWQRENARRQHVNTYD